MGNIRSLARALERAGAMAEITDDPGAIARAERLVIPGQGEFGQAMERLTARGIAPLLAEAIRSGRPVLGVCLGLQVLFEGSEEAPGVAGLAILPGTVRRLAIAPGFKRPHMGWSSVQHEGGHPVLAANPSGEAFYFVHSYAPFEAHGLSVATAANAETFIAAVARGPLAATQFHPEKSQDAGERLLRAWLAL